MRLANVVIAGNDYLATHAQQAGTKRVEIIPSVLDTKRYKVKTKSKSNENEIVPWMKPFKTSFSPFPINFFTGKVYQGINVFLLNLACLQHGYPKNSWLTFKQAKQMGGYMKKGQSSETILFWKSTYGCNFDILALIFPYLSNHQLNKLGPKQTCQQLDLY